MNNRNLVDQYLQEDGTLDVLSPIVVGDHELFMGPLLPGAAPFITTSRNVGEILSDLGLAPSRNWCRKNNWWRELQPGYHEITFGSKRIKLCILMG